MKNFSGTQSPSSKTHDLVAPALIAALVLLFFWRIITPKLEDRAVFPPGDFTDQFWAFRMYEARAIAVGRLPLWSEDFNSGHPFLADVQSAIFYPVGLMFTFVIAGRGAEFTLLDLELEAILHFVLAGTFTYFFAQRLLGSRVAALVSAIIWTFGGYLTSYPPQQLAILETATWLPLALLFLDLAVNTHKLLYYMLAGLTFGIAALAGHPQAFLFVVYACAIYFVWRVASGERRFQFHVSRFILALLIAAGISAMQWIPTLEYQSVSTRIAITWAEAAHGFPTLDPLQMILPGSVNAFQSPLYIGILPLWLAVTALFVNRSREKVFWAALALGSLLVSFGFYAFAYALFYLFVPGFALFRDQERLALVISFSLAILAGYGMRDLLDTHIDLRRVRRAWMLLPAGVVISMMMLFALYISGTVRSSGRVAFLGDRAGLMALLFLLASAVIAWWIRNPHPIPLPETKRAQGEDRVLLVVTIALITFDLFSIDNAAYNADPKPRYPTTSIIQTIQNDRDVFRVVDEGKMPGHFGLGYRLEEIGGISPLRVARYDTLLDSLPEETLWPLLNVRYVITGRPGFASADLVMNDGDTRLLRLQSTLPRAWFVASAVQGADDHAALDAMKSDSFDPRAIAYISDSLPFPINADSARGTMTFKKRDPEHLVILVNAPADGLLVLSEVYYPGWSAAVDGASAPILRADVALRAVPVRAGAHRIEMIFDPGSVKIGMAISIATLLMVLLGMLTDALQFGRQRD